MADTVDINKEDNIEATEDNKLGEVKIAAKSMKGVNVEVNDDKVCVDLSVNVSYNYNIPEVSEKVQERVKNAIENMTGLTVLEVNIKIATVVAK